MKTQNSPSGGVTQQDVARHLGVSRAWVARALGGDPKITEHSRRRVLEASEELGYKPHANREARILAARRNGQKVRYGTIGYLPQSAKPLGHLAYWMELQGGIHDALHDSGFELILMRPGSTRSWEKVDGVLAHSEDAAELLRTLPVPLPFVSLMLPEEGFASVTADDAGGVRQAVQHLVELGHRRIGYLIHSRLAQPGPDSITPLERRRHAAYLAALQKFGIEPQPEWVWDLENCGDFVLRGRHSMWKWIRNGWRETGCTALLAQNDRAAIGAMEALQEAGLRVPDDVSVIGFDSTSECLLVRPNLTSVNIDLHGIGAAGVAMLLRQIRGETTALEAQVLPAHLDVRASTAPV